MGNLRGFTINGGNTAYFTNAMLSATFSQFGKDVRFVDGHNHIGTLVKKAFDKYYTPNNVNGLKNDSLIYVLKVDNADFVTAIVKAGYTDFDNVRYRKAEKKEKYLQIFDTNLAVAVLKDNGLTENDLEHAFDALTFTIGNIQFDGDLSVLNPAVVKKDKVEFPLFTVEQPDSKAKVRGVVDIVIDSLPPEGQYWVREYNRRCKETRLQRNLEQEAKSKMRKRVKELKSNG